jgi:CDP-diacylglycerol---serine O-phosphatidyltransferase
MIRRNLPNMLTLINLLCGCIGLVEVLQNNFITGACLFMVVALVADFFDGFLARALGVSSPIGKELDSLADMVTFGVLPAAMMVWVLKNHTQLPDPYHNIGFLIALFSAWRLAKFNIDTRQSDSFIGVPTPANAMFVAAMALNIESGSADWLSMAFGNSWVAVGMLLLLCYLMVAELPLMAFKFKTFGWVANKLKYTFLVLAVLALLWFKTLALPWVIIAYVLLSVLQNIFKKD